MSANQNKAKRLFSLPSIPAWALFAWKAISEFNNANDTYKLIKDVLANESMIAILAFLSRWGWVLGFGWLTLLVLWPGKTKKESGGYQGSLDNLEPIHLSALQEIISVENITESLLSEFLIGRGFDVPPDYGSSLEKRVGTIIERMYGGRIRINPLFLAWLSKDLPKFKVGPSSEGKLRAEIQELKAPPSMDGLVIHAAWYGANGKYYTAVKLWDAVVDNKIDIEVESLNLVVKDPLPSQLPEKTLFVVYSYGPDSFLRHIALPEHSHLTITPDGASTSLDLIADSWAANAEIEILKEQAKAASQDLEKVSDRFKRELHSKTAEADDAWKQLSILRLEKLTFELSNPKGQPPRQPFVDLQFIEYGDHGLADRIETIFKDLDWYVRKECDSGSTLRNFSSARVVIQSKDSSLAANVASHLNEGKLLIAKAKASDELIDSSADADLIITVFPSPK